MQGPRTEVRLRHGAWQVRCRSCHWHDSLPVTRMAIAVRLELDSATPAPGILGPSLSWLAWRVIFGLALRHARSCRGPL